MICRVWPLFDHTLICFVVLWKSNIPRSVWDTTGTQNGCVSLFFALNNVAFIATELFIIHMCSSRKRSPKQSQGKRMIKKKNKFNIHTVKNCKYPSLRVHHLMLLSFHNSYCYSIYTIYNNIKAHINNNRMLTMFKE